MADGLNEAKLIGNLGADAELRSTQNGRHVLNWRMATTHSWVGDDGAKKEATQWHACVMWGKRAEALAKYLEKGTRIYACGRIETRNYEDKDGVKRYVTEIQVQDVILLGGRRGDDRDRDDRDGKRESRDNRSDRNGQNERVRREEERLRPRSNDDDKPPF